MCLFSDRSQGRENVVLGGRFGAFLQTQMTGSTPHPLPQPLESASSSGASFLAWQRRARNASDWWWTARDHGAHRRETSGYEAALEWHTSPSRRVCHWCFYHILTSSVIYFFNRHTATWNLFVYTISKSTNLPRIAWLFEDLCLFFPVTNAAFRLCFFLSPLSCY